MSAVFFGGSLLHFWSQGLSLNPAPQLATLAGHLSPSILLSPPRGAEIAGTHCQIQLFTCCTVSPFPDSASSSAHGWPCSHSLRFGYGFGLPVNRVWEAEPLLS